MRVVRPWVIALAAAVFILGQEGAKAEPVNIRVSWIAPLSNWASLLLEKKELARHMGQSYIFEPVRYAGTPQMITAPQTGNSKSPTSLSRLCHSPFRMPGYPTCASVSDG